MMISYHGLSKLKTKKVVYPPYSASSNSGLLEQFRNLSSKRKAIEDFINMNNSVTEAIAREISGGLTSRCEQDAQKLENYLPLLEDLVQQIRDITGKNSLNSWISSLELRWSSVLSSSSKFKVLGPKFYRVDSICFELGMMLFLYGSLLRERALELLSSDLVRSASLLRKASGVYDYLARTVLVKLRTNQEKPPEATCAVSSVMSLICLAEAQAVTARKAEENNNTPGFLVKLHYGVKEFLDEAISMFEVAKKECKDITSHLLDYIISCRTLHELKSYRHLAESAKSEGKVGISIKILTLAIQNAKKSVPKDESWRTVYKRSIDETSQLLRKYEHENEFVWHEKVARDDDPNTPLPKGLRIVSPIPYLPRE